VTFCYLEWYRARQLARRDLSGEEKKRWGWQRSHGVGEAIRHEAEDHDLRQLLRWSGTRTGVGKLRRGLRAALGNPPPEKTQRKHAG
jgi:hypothetical protein